MITILPLLPGNGWEMINWEIQVVWDSVENIKEVNSFVKIEATNDRLPVRNRM
jgi:hypothetical protein